MRISSVLFSLAILPSLHAAGEMERKAAPENNAMVRKLNDPLDGVGGDAEASHIPKYYQTGSCTCAKDAYMEIYKEATSQLKMVPLLPEVYCAIEMYINQIVDFAVCALHEIDCGCDQQEYKIFNYYKMSTYQCCCDVDSMKSVIISAIRELASSWEMTMDSYMNTVVNTGNVYKKLCYDVYQRIVQSAVHNIEKIGYIYNIPYKCEKSVVCDYADYERLNVKKAKDSYGVTIETENCVRRLEADGDEGDKQLEVVKDRELDEDTEDEDVESEGYKKIATYWGDKDWVAFNFYSFDYEPGCKFSISFDYRRPYASSNQDADDRIEIRLDGVYGKLVGTFDPTRPSEGSKAVGCEGCCQPFYWSEEICLTIPGDGDYHTIYLVGVGGTPSSSQIWDLKNVKITSS